MIIDEFRRKSHENISNSARKRAIYPNLIYFFILRQGSVMCAVWAILNIFANEFLFRSILTKADLFEDWDRSGANFPMQGSMFCVLKRRYSIRC